MSCAAGREEMEARYALKIYSQSIEEQNPNQNTQSNPAVLGAANSCDCLLGKQLLQVGALHQNYNVSKIIEISWMYISRHFKYVVYLATRNEVKHPVLPLGSSCCLLLLNMVMSCFLRSWLCSFLSQRWQMSRAKLPVRQNRQTQFQGRRHQVSPLCS